MSVDRVGGALGQQWLQRLIQEAVAQNRPTDKRQGAPATLISNLLGPAQQAGADAATGGALSGLGQARDFLMNPAPTSMLPGQGGALGAVIGGADAVTGGGASRLGQAIGGLFGGPAAPAALPPSIANSAANSLVGSGGAGPLGATAGGAAAGALAPSTSAPVSITDPVRAPGYAGPGGMASPATGMPGAAGGGGIAPGGVGAPDSLMGATDPNLTSIDTVRELLDTPSFAVQDMLRDRGINPGRNKYAGMMAQRLTPIFGELSALALAQAGVGSATSEADTVKAYNTFINNFMGGKVDKGQLLRTAMAQAEADPGGTMASLIRDMGPEGLAQLIGALGGQGRMLGQATQRMLGERAMDAKRRQQALAEKGQVTEDDLSFLPSFRGSI